MKPELKQAFDAAMTAAIGLYEAGKFEEAFAHLELAHVLGQRHAAAHAATHCWMRGCLSTQVSTG